MKKSVKKNYIYNLIYQILAIIIPVLTTPYLGAGGTGIYSYTISIVKFICDGIIYSLILFLLKDKFFNEFLDNMKNIIRK